MRKIVSLFILGIVVCSVSASAQHLYVGNNNHNSAGTAPGGFRQYDLPIGSSSTPNFTVPLDGVTALDVDSSGNVAAGDMQAIVSIYPSPLSAASTRSAAFPLGGFSTFQVAFTPEGDLFAAFVGSTAGLLRFSPPFSNSSTSEQTVFLGAGNGPVGVAFDAAQNLFVSIRSGTSSSLFVYAPPYTGAPVRTAMVAAPYRQIAVSAAQVFATATTNHRVDVYTLPITAGSAPAFSITAGLNLPQSAAVDSFGNLYVGDVDGTVTEYRPPFSSSSAPTVTLQVPGYAILGLAVEKTGLGVLPAVASSAGAFGSFFRTGVQLHNSTAAPMSGRIVFHRAGTVGTDADPSLSYALNPGETENIPDLVQATGQQGLGSADLLPATGGFPAVVARVFNDAGKNGTTGFTEDLVKQENALGVGDQFTLVFPPDLTRFRYNIGVRSLAGGASITVTQRNSSGTVLRTVSKTYTAHYFEQVDAATFLGATPSPNDSLAVSVTAGNLFIYGATTDNTTQDPSVQIGRK